MEFDKEYYKENYKKNREQILSNRKIWRKRNKAKIKEQNKNYYLKKNQKFVTLICNRFK